MAPSKKGALKDGNTPVFIDESAFYLLPSVVATWAPQGETPVLSAPLSRDHLSAIAAVTESGRLSVWTKEGSIQGPDVVRFLRHLTHVFGNHLLIGWDGATIHRGQVVKEYLASAEGSGIRLFSWPGYAPELDPTEGVWRYSKQKLLANVSHDDLVDLRHGLAKAFHKLRDEPEIIQAFFRQALL